MFGIFAGRGDVIISMVLSFGLGFWAGYKVKSMLIWLKDKFKKQ